MYKIVKHTVFFLLMLLSGQHNGWAGGNNDSLKTKTAKYHFKRPVIGIGSGLMSFKGDVGISNVNNVFEHEFGYFLDVRKQFNPNFSLAFTLNSGHIFGEEKSLERNLNFKSYVFGESFNMEYAFNRIWKFKNIAITPYASVGAGFVFFRPMGDLLDADGNTYYYWEDGTIRTLAENDPNADNAGITQRDYNYETDLRDANIDGLGKYPLVSFMFPLNAGINFHVSPRVTIKIGTVLYPTLTDLMDNVNVYSVGERQGNVGFDNILMPFAAFYFNPNILEKEPIIYNGIDLIALGEEDTDGDGIIDFEDECPDTPLDIEVDANGCPPDDDLDGVPNYRDKELNTPFGALVNADGYEITDRDSLIPESPSLLPDQYAVQVGAFTDGVPKYLLDKYLTYEDLEKHVVGNVTVYTVGRYISYDAAASRKKLMEQDSIPNPIVVTLVNGEFTPVLPPEIKGETNDSTQIDSLAEKDSLQTKQENVLDHFLDSVAQAQKVQDSILSDSLSNVNEDSVNIEVADVEVPSSDQKLEQDTSTGLVENEIVNISQSFDDSVLAETVSKTAIDYENIDTSESPDSNMIANIRNESENREAEKYIEKAAIAEDLDTSELVEINKETEDFLVTMEKENNNDLAHINNIESETVNKSLPEGDSLSDSQLQIEKEKQITTQSTLIQPTNESITASGSYYTVLLESYDKKVPNEDISRLLMIQGVESSMYNNQKIYTAGKYTNYHSAENMVSDYRDQGFKNAGVLFFNNGKYESSIGNEQKMTVEIQQIPEDKIYLDNTKGDMHRIVSEKVLTDSKANDDNMDSDIVEDMIPAFNGPYNVLLAEYEKSVPQNMINKLLSIEAVVSTRINGKTYYTLKGFNTIDEAKNAFKQMMDYDFNNLKLVEYKNKKFVKIDYQPPDRTSLLVKHNDSENQKIDSEQINSGGLIFRVQLGAFVTGGSKAFFINKGVSDIVSFPAEGYTKYVSGTFNTYDKAVAYREDIKQTGFSDAFVVAYRNGEKINISTVVSTEMYKLYAENIDLGNKLVYKVQIGVFKGHATSALYNELKDITIEYLPGGEVKYLSGVFANYEDAQKYKEELVKNGIKDAFVVSYKGDKKVTHNQ